LPSGWVRPKITQFDLNDVVLFEALLPDPLGPSPDSSAQLRIAHSLAPRNQIARRRGLINGPASIGLKEELEFVARMISGLINGLEKRAG
jgi:hypothetical protein